MFTRTEPVKATKSIKIGHWPAFAQGFPLRSAHISTKQLGWHKPKKHSMPVKPRPLLTATIATDEISRVIAKDLNLGSVTSMSRAGSSGWAVMHKATTDKGKRLFIKVSREDAEMFEGEREGLYAMFKTNTIRVPEAYHCGRLNGVQGSFIIMESLDLHAIYSQERLGDQLGKMHLAEPVVAEAKQGKFGFVVDNTLGATPQPNGWMDDWVEFFRERRLRHQLLLTNDANLITKGDELCSRLDELFEDVKGTIKPSILHGDLWSGNVSGLGRTAEPVIFDPASYYGHHEAEFGMSWCMDLTSAFWGAYRNHIPEAEGFKRRLKLYQLYHYLNHFNLFGGGYYGMSDLLLTQLLKGIN
ncbi:Protein-ribulosamine 3-kinase, chloroplastic [Gracilariopsis chorda]|uniref:protein-ribulosamine 3-kinase n=1 Tax=Gracilariopsis chorda TaxID=448386 RepID=A0A2V3J208_9FLOR|nr:Protein-ribulosamine 3-kinase, chloroplastic [Gracilariopsis chorda]|eukprot:PXF48373.1 Protein-ribulosamine 3-kinase, chloroplastic [Gracilariopsis chorda]